MTFKYLTASLALAGLALCGHAQAATPTKDFAACVWSGTTDAERTALIAPPDQLAAKGQSFDQIAQAHPATSAAIDRCSHSDSTPALWKGHFIADLNMEHWAASELKTKPGIDTDTLENAWNTVPADQQICFGILTAWAIVSTDATAESRMANLPLKACTQLPAKNAMQAFIAALRLDPQSDAAGDAGIYAFGKGGEAIVIQLMTSGDARPSQPLNGA